MKKILLALCFALWVPFSVQAVEWVYPKAQYTQRLVISNGQDSNLAYHLNQDDLWANAPRTVNPNRLFPWRVSGGLPEGMPFHSVMNVKLPEGKKIRVWWERVEAGARRPLPQLQWAFPEGTVFTDTLIYQEETFEVRTREKTKKGWDYRTAFRKAELPPGYKGAGKRCIECHEKAGSQDGYGIRIRGCDQTFSFPVVAEEKGPTKLNPKIKDLVEWVK